jgi:toxin HigB-1
LLVAKRHQCLRLMLRIEETHNNHMHSGSKKGIRSKHSNRLARILDRLNAASDIKDMNYPGSFLHQLSGDKKGFHSVRVSGNWRIFFQFIDGDAYVVDYDDYH